MTSLAFVMGRGGPSLELHPCRPPASLLSLPVLGSIFIHTGMIILGQLAALFSTTSQEWCADTRLLQQTHITGFQGVKNVVVFLFFIPGTFRSIRLGLELKICPTWRTAACLFYLVSSTSSWLWWSPKVTPTRNRSTTTVSEPAGAPGVQLCRRSY